jgi:hypothetical protein
MPNWPFPQGMYWIEEQLEETRVRFSWTVLWDWTVCLATHNSQTTTSFAVFSAFKRKSEHLLLVSSLHFQVSSFLCNFFWSLTPFRAMQAGTRWLALLLAWPFYPLLQAATFCFLLLLPHSQLSWSACCRWPSVAAECVIHPFPLQR